MIVLGIDPGTHRMGYALVLGDRGKTKLLEAGILPKRTKGLRGAELLVAIKKGLDDVVRRRRPAVLSIERLYFSKNQKTALSVAEARGVALLAAAEHGLEILEYAPSEVKLGIAGHGSADKRAVQKMVSYILGGVRAHEVDDASDAIALALLALQDGRLRGGAGPVEI